MVGRAIRADRSPAAFERLYRAFLEHFGYAVLVTWLAAAIAATRAPWLRNIRGLLDPAARPESTASFLFCLPLVMAVAWTGLLLGRDRLRRTQAGKNHAVEFGFAAVVALLVFSLAIARIVTAVSLAS